LPTVAATGGPDQEEGDFSGSRSGKFVESIQQIDPAGKSVGMPDFLSSPF
jgi:hypothetical protein